MRPELVRLLVLLTLALALPALVAREARACTCAGSRAPCQAYWEADAVFVGEVVGESKVTEGGEAPDGYWMRLVRFAVEQPMRGVEGAEAEVVTGQGGGDCGYPFKRGVRYVVYAYRGDKDGRLHTGICMRTRPLAEADEDLAFARGLNTAEPAATVFGAVFRRNYEPKEGESWRRPVADAELTIEDAGRESKADSQELKTDAEGRFRVSGLAPGKYRVTLKVPPGLFYEDGSGEKRTVVRDVEVTARGCAEAEFNLESDTRVAGRVLEASGRPAANLRLQMRGAPSDARRTNAFLYAETDAEGRFEFRAVPPGEYLLGLRILSSVGKEYLPYPRTYFPGTPSEQEAAVIKVREGQHLGGLEMRLPERLEEYEVAGEVVWEDGRPAPGASVNVQEGEDRRTGDTLYVRADDRGHFALKVFDGLSYKISAYARDTNGAAAQSPWVEVPPRGARPVRLVIPIKKQ
ncbi:MAG TPA: SpaA isopeptide-forming pilin-related protein [Pyrinomonadaceae bacterium]|nr:SpaA isopeptide-forming pilin-related protein [Pyrinomonadaceae bacterium]